MRIFIGVAWPYASGPRHLGHVAGAYLPADIVARYHRLAGDEVLVVSGSDQHGTPITVAAEQAGVSPAEFADQQHELIASSFARLGISFDHYTKTSTSAHRDTVQKLFLRLLERGLIEEGQQRSAWCPAERRSLPDRYVEGTCPRCGVPDARGDQCDTCGEPLDPEQLQHPHCRRCNAEAEFTSQRQFFLRLDLLQHRIERFVDSTGNRWRRLVLAETRGWLEQGLRPRAITRDLPWGVPVPLAGWDDRRLYVWFDAVIGYLSATIEWEELNDDPDGWERWWFDPDAEHRYFIGKDNTPFHTLWWPAILLGADQDLHLPDDVVANHYLTLAGHQFSTSRGHGFGVDEAIERVGLDPLRHALCALNPETGDVDFTWAQVDDLTRSGLLGAIANPVYRVTTLLWKRFNGQIDLATWHASSTRASAAEELAQIGSEIRACRLRNALARVHDIGKRVNRELASREPWHLPHSEALQQLTELLPYLDALGLASWPFVPTSAGRIRDLLGREEQPTKWHLEEEPPRVRREPEPPLR